MLFVIVVIRLYMAISGCHVSWFQYYLCCALWSAEQL